MDDQTLKHLLQQADAASSAPSRPLSADDLLAAARRRRSSRAAATAVSLAVVAIAVGVLWHMQSASDQANTNTVVISKIEPLDKVHKTAHRIDLASLEREAQMHEQIAHALLASSEPEQPAVESPTTDDDDLVRLEAARSAAISWQYATYVESDLNDLQAARREYQRIADRFPGTTWEKLAKTSLERLPPAATPPSL